MRAKGRPASRAWTRKVNVPLMGAVLATLLCVWLYWMHRAGTVRLPLVDLLELKSVDARFSIRGERSPVGERIVVVALDDRTRREAPQLFQLRAELAKLIDALAKYRPQAAGYDALFSSPEINLPKRVIARVRKAARALREAGGGRTPRETDALEALDAVLDSVRGDEILARAIARAGFVHLGIMFYLEDGEDDPLAAGSDEPPGVSGARYREAAVVEQPRSRRPPRAEAYVAASLPAIAKGAAGAGALNIVVDSDSDTRRVYGVVEHGGRYYMPLGLSVAMEALDQGAEVSYVTGESAIRFGEHELPTDERGILQLAFLGPAGTFPHVSAADVLDGSAPREALAGKLVFIGRTDAATDRYATPFDPVMPGVEIHATLAHNALHDELLRRASPVTTLITILLLGLAISALQLRVVRHRRAWIAGAGGLLVLAAYWVVVLAAFNASGLVLDFAAPSLSCVAVVLASTTAGLATEGRERAQLRSAFSQYVQSTLVERILDDPDRARLGGVRRDLTVLFSDIRGFSRFSEGLDPQALSDLLNEYLTPMTELVMNNNGMLDKYIGDAVMAVYGAPLEMPDHAAAACNTALQMQRELVTLNEAFRARALPEIVIGVGINSGPMSVGNMGSEKRFDYTVLGDAVNLGARLEALTKEYRCSIIVGERTRELAGDAFAFRELDLVRVTGREGTARIYELVETPERSPLSAADLKRFARGLAAYREARWDVAERQLKKFAEDHPVDGPVHVFLARIEELRAQSPSDWDGVYEQQFK